MSQLAALEALLFTAGEDGLDRFHLASMLDVDPVQLEPLIKALIQSYDQNPDSSLTVIETKRSLRLVTKPAYASLLEAYAQTPMQQSLSRASLEVLSIVAYRQPITRIEIDAIRGVNSSGALTKLQGFGLIKEVGKKETLGRPNLYGTTDYFLDYMGMNQLEDLPQVQVEEEEEQEKSLFRIEEENEN
ncbi:SMC-Scp complex subunit ScpB [Streptococcus sp. NLN76]|uniref:SMC-Scp complex subunit ScpB n=1 Tax=Streptococcus sp. NLN76 TaxID=2822800 RepID=UPI0018AA79BA|nr:SMC-Scp complex subunit ScpB [Streptococcus sp. NLN76]MBF8970099.1 segregation/condensation protein B [Streptococcus sp. NLN76]